MEGPGRPRQGGVDEQALAKELRGATTLMLRHIPNSVKVSKLVEMLVSAGFGQQVDYVFLPCDKKRPNHVVVVAKTRVLVAECKRARDWHVEQ